jgi:epoxyqueuosine reductase QueG
MTEPDVRDVTVTYRDSKARKVDVKTTRYNGGYAYHTVYKFSMDGSTAVLKRVDPDGEEYDVHHDTAQLAADAARDLPFVQAVAMFPEVDA